MLVGEGCLRDNTSLHVPLCKKEIFKLLKYLLQISVATLFIMAEEHESESAIEKKKKIKYVVHGRSTITFHAVSSKITMSSRKEASFIQQLATEGERRSHI